MQRVFPREADAAMHLDRAARHMQEAFGDVGFRQRRGPAGLVGFVVERVRCEPVQAASRLDLHREIRELMPQRLEHRDLPAELLAFLAVLDRHVETATGATKRIRRQQHQCRILDPGRHPLALGKPLERSACELKLIEAARAVDPTHPRADGAAGTREHQPQAAACETDHQQVRIVPGRHVRLDAGEHVFAIERPLLVQPVVGRAAAGFSQGDVAGHRARR